MTAGKFRKKPVVIDAWHWMGERDLPVEWSLDVFYHEEGLVDEPRPYLTIHTLEGIMRAFPGDWIIRGVRGELYPCKLDIFEATYEPV